MVNYSLNLVNLKLELILKRGLDWPTWAINLPIISQTETVIDEDTKTLLVEISVDPATQQIVFSNIGKLGFQTVVVDGKIIKDQYIGIKKIWANDVFLEQESIKSVCSFYPKYQEHDYVYAKENQVELPDIKSTLDFFYNGDWILQFEQPFFIWYNKLIMNNFDSVNHWYKQTHLGIGDNQQIHKLKQLIKELS